MRIRLELEATNGEEEKVEAALRAEDLIYALKQVMGIVQRANASLAPHSVTVKECWDTLHNLEVAHLILHDR